MFTLPLCNSFLAFYTGCHQKMYKKKDPLPDLFKILFSNLSLPCKTRSVSPEATGLRTMLYFSLDSSGGLTLSRAWPIQSSMDSNSACSLIFSSASFIFSLQGRNLRFRISALKMEREPAFLSG